MVHQSINQSINHSINQSITQSINQSINYQSINQLGQRSARPAQQEPVPHGELHRGQVGDEAHLLTVLQRLPPVLLPQGQGRAQGRVQGQVRGQVRGQVQGQVQGQVRDRGQK